MALPGPIWPGAARCGLAWLGPASLSAERAGATAPRGGQKEPERGRPLLALIWGGGTIMPAPKEGGEAPWEGGSCGWRPAAGQGQRAGQGEGAVTASQPPWAPPGQQGSRCCATPKVSPQHQPLGTPPLGWGQRHGEGLGSGTHHHHHHALASFPRLISGPPGTPRPCVPWLWGAWSPDAGAGWAQPCPIPAPRTIGHGVVWVK